MPPRHAATSVAEAPANGTQTAGQIIALAGRLRLIRARNGATLETVAAASGVTPGHLSRIERGEKLPSMGTLLRLAAALGVPLAELLGGVPVAGEISIVRAPKRSTLTAGGHDSSRYAVLLQQAACAGQFVTAYVIDPAKDLDGITPTAHAGFETVFVLEGEVHLQLGDTVETLRAGDIALFPGYLEHMLRPVDARRRSRALVTIINP